MTESLKKIREVAVDPRIMWVPAGLMVALLGITAAGVYRVSNGINELNARLYRIEQQQRRGWTYSDQQDWTVQLSRRNAALDVPDPRETVDRRLPTD